MDSSDHNIFQNEQNLIFKPKKKKKHMIKCYILNKSCFGSFLEPLSSSTCKKPVRIHQPRSSLPTHSTLTALFVTDPYR